MKKNIRKIVTMVAVAAMAVSSLVGCGSSSAKSSSGQTTITYSIWDKAQEPGMRAIADAFEEKNPSIKVNVEITPWDQYWTKMDAAATGGALPDVFWMHSSQINRYGTNGVLMDLTDKIAESSLVDLNKYPEGLVELYSPNGSNYAIPKDFDTVGLWYNKTLFDEAGIAYPDESWTWETLLETAKTLTNKDKGIYGFGAPLNSHEGYYDFIFQNGGYILSDDKTQCGYDDPATLEAMKWYVDLSLVEGVSPTQKEFAENSQYTLFESGRLAMALFGSWNVANNTAVDYVRENCDVAVLPQGKQRASVYNGLANAVSAKTKNQEEAWKFVEFLGSEEANIIQAESGAAIPAYEGTADKWVEATSQFNTKVFIDMLDYSEILPYSNNSAKWKAIEEESLPKVWNGDISVEEALKQLDKDIEAVLAE